MVRLACWQPLTYTPVVQAKNERILPHRSPPSVRPLRPTGVLFVRPCPRPTHTLALPVNPPPRTPSRLRLMTARLYHGYTPRYHRPYPYPPRVHTRSSCDCDCSHTNANANAFAFVGEQIWVRMRETATALTVRARQRRCRPVWRDGRGG
jgi:hypothetical protein